MYEQEVKRIIIKHYKPSNKKYKTRSWEKCGEEIENFISSEQDKAKELKKFKDMLYGKQCDYLSRIRNQIESEYYKYFSVGSMFDWINGNDNLKELIESL